MASAIDPPDPPSSSDTPITVSLSSLLDSTVPLSTLESAFSPSSLGILIVDNLPPHYPALRAQVLASASQLAHLPPEKLDKLVDADAKYLVGWSHGKETLKDSNKPDKGKGSFYVNCGFYNANARDGADDAADWADFREYTAPSLWPDEADLPNFRASLEGLATLIIDVAVLVARACDRYAAVHVEDYPPPTKTADDTEVGYLEHMVRTSRTTKARLLHYFPPPSRAPQDPASTKRNEDDDEDEKEDEDEDDWCATHLDHGCLTGLTSAMFTDESSPTSTSTGSSTITELPHPPSPSTGLYIRSRSGSTVQVRIPRDALAFQTGEALQLVTRGKFQAVPHFVRGVPPGCDVGRNTLAVFTQPNLGEVVDWEAVRDGRGEGGEGRKGTFGEFARRVVQRNTAMG